jgi:MFS family permease
MRLSRTHDAVSSAELDLGLRRLMTDAAFATIVGTLNSGVVLVAYALFLGASPFVIGLLAAIPFLTQLLQAPAVVLMERVRRRRLISILSLVVARLALPAMAVLSIIPDKTVALALLVIAETIHCAFNAVASCSWNSWIRDLVPEERLGRFFARRTIWATLFGVAGTASAAISLQWAGKDADSQTLVFAALYSAGFLASLISTWSLAKVPEPTMVAASAWGSLGALFKQPFADPNFVRLMRFLASWHFAMNFALPFFTVYMLEQLGYTAGFVLLLSIISQASNLVLLRLWGGLADHFANKTVLLVSAPAFIASVAAMSLAPAFSGAAQVAFLVGLHVAMGMAGAGVTLACAAIAMKQAPRGSSHVYIATSSLVGSAAAGAAPLIGGFLATGVGTVQLGIGGGISLSNWQLYFLLSALMGVYALHRLRQVREEGEVVPSELILHVLNTARRGVRNASPVAGMRAAVAFPAGAVAEALRLAAQKSALPITKVLELTLRLPTRSARTQDNDNDRDTMAA